MSEIIYLPVENHWEETRETAMRQLLQYERAMAYYAIRRSGQLELPFDE